MRLLRRMLRWAFSGRALAAETGGLTLIIVGLHQIYEPAALVFAGAALALIAQGMDGDR